MLCHGAVQPNNIPDGGVRCGLHIGRAFGDFGLGILRDICTISFPKLGIVIPNPAQWLLTEFQDIGRTLQTTLQLLPDAALAMASPWSPHRMAS